MKTHLARRLISLALALCLCIGLAPAVSMQASAATYTYDPDAAIAYAKAHYNDGKGLCAEFVSDCLKAGGFTAVYNLRARDLGRQLQGYGTKISCSGWSSSSCLKASMFNGTLSKGDVIVWENVSGSSSTGHVMLYSGKTNSKGQILVYAHNRAKNEEVIKPSSSASTVYAIHLTSTTENNYTYSFNYNANGGTLGSSGAFSVSYGDQFQVLNTTCTRSGYTWAGWNVKRNNDNKWYVDGQGWCTESEINNNGYIKKVYPNYKTLTLDNSWIGGISGNGSYTFYAVWVQSRQTRTKIFMSPYGEGWDHLTAMNNAIDAGFSQQQMYVWYVIYDANTGALLNTYQSSDYNVNLAIYDPNGNLIGDYDYDSNDANWIKVNPQAFGMSGRYVAKATVTGDLTDEVTTTYDVSYDVELLASPESVSLNLNGTNSQTIAITPSGAYPGEKNANINYNGSYVSVSSRWSNGQILVTVSGLKRGNTSIRVDLYEEYSGNKNVVAQVTIPITITSDSYTITYNANGGSGAPSSQIKYHGTNITLSATAPTRSGYTFLGWATSSTATSATYQPNSIFSSNVDTTLYAVWKANVTSLNASSSNSAVISTGGEKKYFTFTPNKNGIYVIYSTGTSDTRVYLYDENGTQVNFNDDGGEGSNFRLEAVLAGGTKYTYAVEYYNSSTTGTINFNFGLVYSVSYNANGGENAPESQDKDYGASLTLSSVEPTRSGYDFVGWATSSTATSATYQSGGTYANDTHITLYAVWKVSDETPWTECGENVRYKYYINKGIVIIHASTLNNMYENFYDFDGDSRIRQASITAGSVSNYLFRDCVNLTTVNLSYVKTIGICSFTGCTSLETVTLSDELTTIGVHAFSDCTSLREVVLPEGLEVIDSLAFYNTGLSQVTIPKSVTTIKGGAFDEDVVIYGYINSAAHAYAKLFNNPFVPLDVPTLKANTVTNVASILTGGYVQYYTYTPTSSGTYVVYSEGSADTVVELYDIYGSALANDDNSGSNNNFRLEYNLTAGTKYLFAVKYSSATETGAINVRLRNIYSIKFYANEGHNAPATQNKEYGVDIKISSTKPMRNGYTFLGWSTSSDAASVVYQPGSTVTSNEDIDLYAVWQANPSLSENSTYSASISSGGQMICYMFTPSVSSTYVIYSTGSNDTKVYLYNANGTELDSDDDDGEGNNFRLECNLTAGTTYTFGVRYYNSSDTGTISFAFGNMYTVSYDTNGGSAAPSAQNKDYGAGITLSSAIPTRTGYTFLGWATSATATSASYQPGDRFFNDANTTFYAVWKADTYTVSYNANGGSGEPGSQIKNYGVDLTLSTTKPTREGYTFLGWSISSTANSANYQPGDTFTSNENTTLYAIWSKADVNLPSAHLKATNNLSNIQTVTINMYDDEGVFAYYWGTDSVYSNNEYRQCSFVATNINTQKEVSEPGVYGLTVVDVNGNVSATYIITFYETKLNANGGNVSTASIITQSGLSMTLPTPTRSGYDFLGWATSSTANSATYQPGDSFTSNANTTLYAVWSLNKYEITYNANGGTNAPAAQSKSHGMNITLSTSVPTKAYTITFDPNGGTVDTTERQSSCVFLGWATSSTASSAAYQPGGIFTTNANTTLYAVWKNPTLSRYSTPVRAGYVFSGWYTAASGGTQVSNSTVVSSDMTVYAHWEVATYAVNFDANGGTGEPASQTKTHGANLTLSTVIPTRTNHTFLGWATEENPTEVQYQPGDVYTENSDIMLIAVWQGIVITKIEVTKDPTKTTYEIGEELDLTGMELKVTYSDGTTKAVDSGFTTTGFNSISAGPKTVTVNYGNVSTSFTVIVMEEEVDPNAPQITVNGTKGRAGATVSVAISLKNNPGIASMRLKVDYDSSVLSLVGVNDLGKLGSQLHSDQYTDPYVLCWANDTVTQNFTHNGDIVVLTFKINDDAAIGTYDISISYDYDKYDIHNVQVQKVKFYTVDGAIEVVDVLPGDANGDGSVDTLDRLTLSRYLANWKGYTLDQLNFAGADINSDGSVDTLDRLILSRHLANWSGYEDITNPPT